jgi:hypothetical protein
VALQGGAHAKIPYRERASQNPKAAAAAKAIHAFEIHAA